MRNQRLFIYKTVINGVVQTHRRRINGLRAKRAEKKRNVVKCAICAGTGWYMREREGARHPNQCPNGCTEFERAAVAE